MMALLFALTVALGTAQAVPNAELEREARVLESMLIAPCCFTQQVSVHQSPAADEVRKDVRARLAAGENRQQILDAYVAQYGRHVLAEPPAEGFDITLYIMPLLILFGSMGLLALVVRRFTRQQAPFEPAVAATPDPAANARLDDELRDLD